MINIKGEGVHVVHDVWLTMFNHYCINFNIKGWGSAMLPPFGGNTNDFKYTI